MYALDRDDSEFLGITRAAFILVMVMCHVGAMWFWRPYSEFLAVVVPAFFFMSGSVSYYSFNKSPSTAAYLKKRVFQLLLPYYVMCLFVLFVSIFLNRGMPLFSISALVCWLTLTPHQGIMPFPMVQVWFLHTLTVIMLISPLLFFAYERWRGLLCLFVAIALGASTVQLGYDVAGWLDLRGHNLFRAMVYSILFIAGFVTFGSQSLRKPSSAWLVVLLAVVAEIALVFGFGVNPDYAYHMAEPDLYFLGGCVLSIGVLLIARHSIVRLSRQWSLSARLIRFLVKHTFSIYLLHTFAIFLVEEVFGFNAVKKMTLAQGAMKLMLVFAVLGVLSPLFTKVCNLVARFLMPVLGVVRSAEA